MNDLKFANWTLNVIREDGISMGWFEERRFDWCQIAYNFVSSVINGYTIILCTDSRRKWFGDYVLQTINLNKGRALIPIFNIDSMFRGEINTNLVEDVLNISFGDKYIIWYIGHLDAKISKFAIETDNSFIWSFDSGLHTAFNLNSNDANLDIKLLQLFKVLDRTINALMFNEIES